MINRLAARTGMTVRNLRSHASRGLLPPPQLRGRTAYCGADHVARLQLIAGLQQRGFSLAAIEAVVAHTPAGDAEQALEFYRGLLAPWQPEDPLEMTYGELTEWLGDEPQPATLERLHAEGTLERLGEDRVRITNPGLLRAGAQSVRLDIPVEVVMRVRPELLAHTRAIAAEYAWTQFAFPLPWTTDILVEGPLMAVAGGLAGGMAGVLLALGLQGRLPRPALARPLFAGSLLLLVAAMTNGLMITVPDGVRADITVTGVASPGPTRMAQAAVRIVPATAVDQPSWLTITAWQGGGLYVNHLVPAGDGSYRTTQPMPLSGTWKTLVRLQDGRVLTAVPIYLPADAAIGKPCNDPISGGRDRPSPPRDPRRRPPPHARPRHHPHHPRDDHPGRRRPLPDA
jgi:DNA-binding transcriptional MerR regulator